MVFRELERISDSGGACTSLDLAKIFRENVRRRPRYSPKTADGSRQVRPYSLDVPQGKSKRPFFTYFARPLLNY